MYGTELIPTGDSEPKLGTFGGSILTTSHECLSLFFPKRVCVQMRAPVLLVRLAIARQTAVQLCVLFPLSEFLKKESGKSFVTFLSRVMNGLKQKHKSLPQRVMGHILGKIIAV